MKHGGAAEKAIRRPCAPNAPDAGGGGGRAFRGEVMRSGGAALGDPL